MENKRDSLEYKIPTSMGISIDPNAISYKQYTTREVVRMIYHASPKETRRTLDAVFTAITGETLEGLIDWPWGQPGSSEGRESAPSV